MGAIINSFYMQPTLFIIFNTYLVFVRSYCPWQFHYWWQPGWETFACPMLPRVVNLDVESHICGIIDDVDNIWVIVCHTTVTDIWHLASWPLLGSSGSLTTLISAWISNVFFSANFSWLLYLFWPKSLTFMSQVQDNTVHSWLTIRALDSLVSRWSCVFVLKTCMKLKEMCLVYCFFYYFFLGWQKLRRQFIITSYIMFFFFSFLLQQRKQFMKKKQLNTSSQKPPQKKKSEGV